MKNLLITLLATMILMGVSHAVVTNPCEHLCVYHRTPGICGVSVEAHSIPSHPRHRFFRNYCDLRKHNCRHPHDRYQAEIDLAHCPGHVINGPYV